MPTYEIRSTDGRIMATGIPSWASAARLADALTRRLNTLCVVNAEHN